MRGERGRTLAPRLAAALAPSRCKPRLTGPAHSHSPPLAPTGPASSLRPRPSPEPVAEAAVGPQGLGKAEIEEAVLGHHISQELRGRLAQVPLPKEVSLGDGRGPRSGPGQAAPAGPVSLSPGALPRSMTQSRL